MKGIILTEESKNNWPRLLQSDNEFRSQEFKTGLADFNRQHNTEIRQTFSLPVRPQQNGAVERANGAIKRLLAMHKKQAAWWFGQPEEPLCRVSEQGAVSGRVACHPCRARAPDEEGKPAGRRRAA